MEIYQNNIETLKKYRPDFLRLYEQTISKKEKYPDRTHVMKLKRKWPRTDQLF